eukprot:5366472-Amphidinium_carterae.1
MQTTKVFLGGRILRDESAPQGYPKCACPRRPLCILIRHHSTIQTRNMEEKRRLLCAHVASSPSACVCHFNQQINLVRCHTSMQMPTLLDPEFQSPQPWGI